jgi:hypothetical protein
MTKSTKEKCVMCGGETQYNIYDHINIRYGYIEGMGQLCNPCYQGSSRSSLLVDHRTIMDTPNDMELGMKVRRSYYESLDIKPLIKWESIGRE